MGMEESRRAKLSEDQRDDTGIKSGPPGGTLNRDSAVSEPPGQLAAGGGDYNLRDSTGLQLTSQQPDLPLPAPPLSARRDVNNPQAHVPGRISAGCA
jgi:hypothetical protein